MGGRCRFKLCLIFTYLVLFRVILQGIFHEDLPRYIATQGPLATTAGDLWAMVLQERCPIIVMLTRVMDGDQVSKFILSMLEVDDGVIEVQMMFIESYEMFPIH